jgi:hypothetical protein
MGDAPPLERHPIRRASLPLPVQPSDPDEEVVSKAARGKKISIHCDIQTKRRRREREEREKKERRKQAAI